MSETSRPSAPTMSAASSAPTRCIKAREAAEKGEIRRRELLRIQHDAIRDVVRLQQEIGLKLATDGEYNRHSWQRDFLLKIGNVKPMASKLTVRFHSAAGTRDHTPPSLQVVGKLSRPHGHFRRRFQVPHVDRARWHDGEDHHSVADHRALPRRPRGDRCPRLSADGCVLRRSGGRLSRRNPRSGAVRLPLSADRRGQSRLSVRSGFAPAGRQYRRGPGNAAEVPMPGFSTPPSPAVRRA